MIYELIVVDNREQANLRPVVINENHVQQTVFVGQQLCGLRYGPYRPNKLTRKHRPLSTEYERNWEVKCLLPSLDWRGVYE